MVNDKYLQDRGTKKWTTMMLPEHKEQLKDMWDHNQAEKRPDFDEQQLEEFNETIIQAYKTKLLVSVAYCAEDIYREQNTHEITGVISAINSHVQAIIIGDTRIYVKDFLDIQINHES